MVEWTIFPVVNYRGHRALWRHRRMCLRNTPNGIDLNRDYADHFERHASDGVPFTSAETQLISQEMLKVRPQLFLTVHSGTEALFYPFAYTGKVKPKHVELMKKVVEKANLKCDCIAGSAQQVLRAIGYNYNPRGDCLDWAVEKAGVPLAYGMELYVNGPEGKLVHKRAIERKSLRAKDMKQPLKALAAGSPVGAPLDANACFMRFNPATKEAYQTALVRATATIASLLEESKVAFDKLSAAEQKQH